MKPDTAPLSAFLDANQRRPLLVVDVTKLRRAELIHMHLAGFDVLEELARRGLVTVH